MPRALSASSNSPAALTNGAVRVLNACDHRHRRIRKTVQRVTVSMSPAPSPPSETYEWNTVATHTYVWDGNAPSQCVTTLEELESMEALYNV